MEVRECDNILLSDDYEEGEILDEDNLFDNVSSLEEFSASDNEPNGHYNDSSSIQEEERNIVIKEKHRRRKEHKCKEDSVCRMERSGKHCYARIRNKGKAQLEVTNKIEPDTMHSNDLQNQKKKTQVILSPTHSLTQKSNSRRIHVQKDLPEKENRINHGKHIRHHDTHKSLQRRTDRKRSTDKQKKVQTGCNVISNGRVHEFRKRARSHSPKLPSRNHIKDSAIPRGTTSLLKRLVGSGSVGVKIPKDTEEPKKIELCSLVDNNNSCDSIIRPFIVDVSHIDAVDGQLLLEIDNESGLKLEEGEIIEKEEIQEPVVKVESNLVDTVTELNVICTEDKLKINNTCKEHSNIHSEQNVDAINTNVIENEDNQKSDHDITEDIDELNLRLEALRTAMLRKHKERQKRGFTCKKKSTVEDESFADYILNNIEKEEALTSDEEEHETDYNGDLLVPEDMVIDKTDKEGELGSNILENYPYPSDYTMQNTSSSVGPLHYVNFPSTYSVCTYPGGVFNNAEEDEDGPCNSGNLNQEFSGYNFGNQMCIPSLQALPPISERIDDDFPKCIGNDENLLENCLKEINSNKDLLVKRKKRIRRLSARFKTGCRRLELDNTKKRLRNSSRAILKRKLEKREFILLKKFRKESNCRDLKIIEREDINTENNKESDEESALRELALKSVKEREKLRVLSEPETQSTNNGNTNGNVVAPIQEPILQHLHIDIDTKPLLSCDSEGTPTNLSSSEPWDDIDEDILRAQLLSSLSKKMDNVQVDVTSTFLPNFTREQAKALLKAQYTTFNLQNSDIKLKQLDKINKENFKKISKLKASDGIKRKMKLLRTINNNNNNNNFKKKLRTNHPINQNVESMIIPKFIISLKEDSSSDDDVHQSMDIATNDNSDVVKSIDLFLHEARIENDIKQGLLVHKDEEMAKVNVESKSENIKPSSKDLKLNITNEKIPDSSGGTPQVLKHLPAWQQEEYRRLKKQIAEKERILKAAKKKLILPFETEETLKETLLVPNNNENNNKIDLINNDDKNACIKNNFLTVTAEVPIKINSNSIAVNSSNESNVHTTEINNGLENGGDVQRKDRSQKMKSLETFPAKVNNNNTDRNLRIIDDINDMGKIVSSLEDEMNNYRSLNRDIKQKKKELLLAKYSLAKKKKTLFEIRRKLMSKEKLIQAKIDEDSIQSELTAMGMEQLDVEKQRRRDLELYKLKMREHCLRTKMLFDEVDLNAATTAVNQRQMKVNSKNTILPIDKAKLPIKSKLLERISPSKNSTASTSINCNGIIKHTKQNDVNSLKKKQTKSNGDSLQCVAPKIPLSVADKQSENWDPFVPICPFDISGVCKDEECQFQHVKASIASTSA